MFKIAEYRPDEEGNLLSIWAGNLSFAGKSFGMSVHVLTGTCARFQQLLTGNAGRGPDPSQRGPAAPATHSRFTARQARKPPSFERNRKPKAPQQHSHGALSVPSGWWDVGVPRRLAQRCLHKGAGGCFAPRTHTRRTDSKHVPGIVVLGCSRREDLATRVILLLDTVTDGQHLIK